MSITTTSNFKIAQAFAQEKMAKLEISHLDKQLTLDREEAQHKFQQDLEEFERKRKLELKETELKRKLELEEAEHKYQRELKESEFKRKRKVMKAKQNLKEASLQRQVFEEESDRAGYIPLESYLSADELSITNEFATIVDALPSKKRLIKSPVPTSFKTPLKSAIELTTPEVSEEDCSRPTTLKLLDSGPPELVRKVFPTRESNKKISTWEKAVNAHGSILGFSGWCSTADLNENFQATIPVQTNQLSNLPGRNNVVKRDGGETIFNNPTSAPQIATQTLSNDNQSSIASALLNLQGFNEIPRLEMIKFDGDPREYANFMHTFKLTVDIAKLEFTKKLLYLIQYCKGEAKRLIKYCLLLNLDEGYEKALKLLKDNYGRPNVIVRSYCDKLTKGSPIKSNDAKVLRNLAQLLEESDVTLSSLGYPADLDNFNTIVAIVKRLPYYLQTRWLRITVEIEKQGIDPKFKDLVKFVQSEAEIVNSSYASAVNQRMKRKIGSSLINKFLRSIKLIGH